MRKRKTKTKLLANLLMSKPKIVADIFAMGAKNEPVPVIVKTINECWELERRWNVLLTEHYVWSMFHRKAPFQNPAFYRDVMEADKEAIAGRLRSTTPSFTLSDDSPTDEETATHKELLADLLKAGRAYSKALDAVTAAGFDEQSAVNWLEITVGVMEEIEK